jgi:hypothetical protein
MKTVVVAIACSFLVMLALPAYAQDALAAARALYTAARYEDALAAFDAMKSAGGLTPERALAVEQGRAYCLLALGRTADARAAVETVVTLDPFFVPSEDDTPPKILAAFREGRRLALPGALDRLYAQARAAYDSDDSVNASALFSRILALLDDPDLTLDPGRRADLRQTANSFLDQTKSGGPLFDASWKDVTPPVPLQAAVNIPEPLRPEGTARTIDVEVIVTAKGLVESAAVRQPDVAVLAPLLVRAALDWRYKPAVRELTAVRYRMVVPVVIPPRSL